MVRKVARTLSDLEEHQEVSAEAVSLAIELREGARLLP